MPVKHVRTSVCPSMRVLGRVSLTVTGRNKRLQDVDDCKAFMASFRLEETTRGNLPNCTSILLRFDTVRSKISLCVLPTSKRRRPSMHRNILPNVLGEKKEVRKLARKLLTCWPLAPPLGCSVTAGPAQCHPNTEAPSTPAESVSSRINVKFHKLCFKLKKYSDYGGTMFVNAN